MRENGNTQLAELFNLCVNFSIHQDAIQRCGLEASVRGSDTGTNMPG